MNGVRLSYIITTYNSEDYIELAISSLIRQNTKINYEIVIYDDGSTDKTRSILKRLQSSHRQICLAGYDRIGRAKALNKAIQYSRGEIIAINDSDDVSFSSRTTATINAFQENPHAGFVAFEAKLIPWDDKDTLRKEYLDSDKPHSHNHSVLEISPNSIYAVNNIVHSATAFRKTAWKECGGYNENLDLCIDYDFYFRLFSNTTLLRSTETVCAHLLNKHSTFKKVKPGKYLGTLRKIRYRARQEFDISLFQRVIALKVIWWVLRDNILNTRNKYD